ncbi:hypothetical protein KBI23_08145 [bacterium]|nr:hypothetical protein [bacterium]MBP9808423.1 hypothetical protein [bacterium]
MSASEPMQPSSSPTPCEPNAEGSSSERDDKRIGPLAACLESLAHVRKASADKAIAIRETDKQSVRLLRGSVVAALIFLFLPLAGLSKYAIICLTAADSFFLLALAIYIVGRFGILRVMSPRHALVCWQLMLGTSLFAMALAVNAVFLLLINLAGQHLMSR